MPSRFASLMLFVAAVGATCVDPAYAQEPTSRVEEEAARQREKAQRLSPYRPNGIERRILAIEEAGGFGAVRGVVVTFGDIKRGSSIAPGVAYGKTFTSEAIFQAKGAYSIHNYKLAQVWLQAPPMAGGRVRIHGRARWQDAPGGPVFALGPDSPNRRASYDETKTEVSAVAQFRPVRLLRFSTGAAFEAYTTGPADSRFPSVETLQPALPGTGADPDYLHTHASAAIDSRDGDGYSRGGSLLRATVHDYRQQNTGPYSFRRIDGAAEQYVPILHGNSVVYLGARASTTTTANGNVVPFFLMPTLGSSDLRGYRSFRFRDLHSIAVTAEYRWYAQEYLDAAIFYDTGKVVPNRSDLDFRNLTSNVGFGIRLHSAQTTVLRLEVAKGSDGMRYIISFSPIGG